MEVMDDEGELVFLYHLTDGHAGSSFASHVAKAAGIPQEIISRGEEVIQKLSLAVQVFESILFA